MNALAEVRSDPIPEPKFFRENWKVLLATNSKDEYKLVRVRGNVASLTNGRILLRSPLECPDGFYSISGTNHLVVNEKKIWMGYPDVEQARPSFQTMKPLCQISQEVCGQLVQFCEMVRNRRGNIAINKDGGYLVQDTSLAYRFPFNLKEEVLVGPQQLKLALTEMLRYDFVYMSMEKSEDPEETNPLVFGHDWSRCALVMPLQGRYY